MFDCSLDVHPSQLLQLNFPALDLFFIPLQYPSVLFQEMTAGARSNTLGGEETTLFAYFRLELFPGQADNMAGGAAKKLTKEEELLLQDFSRNVTTKSSALFYGNAFIVSAVPICKFSRK